MQYSDVSLKCVNCQLVLSNAIGHFPPSYYREEHGPNKNSWSIFINCVYIDPFSFII